jgi:polygalacturonase
MKVAKFIQLLLLVGTAQSKSFDVTAYGAKGDGVADDSTAIRAAVTAAAASGEPASVLFPSGTYLTNPINVTSDDTTLEVMGTIKGRTGAEDPRMVFGVPCVPPTTKGGAPTCPGNVTTFPRGCEGGSKNGVCHPQDESGWKILPPLPSYGSDRDIGANGRYQALILFAHARNVKIVGTGTIDGAGPWWWDQHKNRTLHIGRPHLIEFYNCTGVEMADVTLRDSPFWTLHPYLSRDVHIHHLTIRARLYAPNADGIDPDSCRNVLIEENDISCGDDHVAIKSGLSDAKHTVARENYPVYVTRNVTVRRNIMRTGMGISVGSETSGGMEDVLVEGNTLGLCDEGRWVTNCLHVLIIYQLLVY